MHRHGPVTDCLFSRNADGLWQCANCGWVYPLYSDKPPRRNCGQPETVEPWSPEEAEWIRQELCGPCPNRKGERCRYCETTMATTIPVMLTRPAGCPVGRW